MKLKYICLLCILSCLLACDDFLEEQPADQIISDLVLTDARSVEQAIFGLYEEINNSQGNYHTALFSLMADGLSAIGTAFEEVDRANFHETAFNEAITFWESNYLPVYRANFILEKIPSLDLEDNLDQQLTAETRFLRAWIYYYLTQLYGDVALLTTTDLEVNQFSSRNSSSEIYDFLITELQELIPDLPDQYGSQEESNIRATRAAAQSLLARVSADLGDWQDVETLTTLVIDNPRYELVEDFESLFASRTYNGEGIFRIYFGPENRAPFRSISYLGIDVTIFFEPTKKLVNAFEEGDLRKATSIIPDPGGIYDYLGNKYRELADNTIAQYYIRLADIYLLRAEARAQQNNLQGAMEDMNRIRNRAGLGDKTAVGNEQALLMIEQERFVELCFEGQRWFDLKRNGRLNDVMREHIGEYWEYPKDLLLQVPIREINNNPNLLPNNQGYN